MKKIYYLLISLIIGLWILNPSLLFNGQKDHLFLAQAQEAQSQTVLLLGIDTGEGRADQGRSDVMMVLQIQEDGSGVLASIPRDSYVEIPGYGMDKINHAYAFGGPQLALATVNQWLGMEIHNYLSVNMTGLKEIVEVVGTITVIPPTSFSIGGYDFQAGVLTELDSDMALQYSRERYTSGGDYGRQARQRDVIQAVINEVASLDNLLRFTQFFTTVTDNMDTNLSLTDLFNLFRYYQQSQDSLISYQLQGSGTLIHSIYYEIIDPQSLTALMELLNQ